MTAQQSVVDLGQAGYYLPLIVLVAGATVLLVLEAFARGAGRKWMMHLTVFTCAIALATTVLVWSKVGEYGAQSLFDGMLIADKFSIFLTGIFILATFLATLLSADFLKEHGFVYGEFYPLVLLAAAGMVILAMASDLVSLFLGVETMSLAAYVLTGSFRRAKRSAEAAMKYFLTGAFATAFLLYGIALVYGATGETNLVAISRATASHTQPIFLIGELLILVALSFKIAAVPFHMWTPDAYEGAPTPVTGFMAAAVKAAGVAGVLRLFLTAFGGEVLPFGHLGWTSVFAVLAVLTMTVGNVAALRQDNIKRLLAYSSIAHAGYLLIGLVAAGVDPNGGIAVPAILFYLLAYTFTTLGAFGVVAWVGRKGDERLLVDDWSGLGQRHPAAALAMTIFLLSLGGFPPTAGFFGKFYVFRAAMVPQDQLLWLVIAGVLNSVISVYYYLRVIMAMYFKEPTREHAPLRSSAMTFALATCAILVMAMGLLPESLLSIAKESVMLALPGSPSP